MPIFNAEKEEVSAFNLEDTYIFKTFFQEDSVFNQLQKYYNKYKYQFEVLEENQKKREQLLDKYYYELEVINKFEDYCAVAEKETISSDILRNSVVRKQRKKHEISIMKNEIPEKRVLKHSAERIEKSEIQNGGN